MVRHEKEIIAALKVGGGDERRRVFKYWEESTVANSARGEKGYKLDCELIELVKKSSHEKAVEEFRQRFLPLCDKKVVAAAGRLEANENRPRRRFFGRFVRSLKVIPR
jgi:hypothetical protein